MSDQFIANGGVAYFHAAANDTSGTGGDGASAAAYVRECGAAASAAPITTGVTVSLLSHASYPAGAYEIAVDTTTGYAADKVYAVFFTLAIDSQNPTGFVGRFSTSSLGVRAGTIAWNGTALASTNPLPNAAPDAAGGLVISDAGGLDIDAMNTAAVRLTAARAQAIDDLIDGGRLDLIFDAIAGDVVNLDGAAMRGTDGANTVTPLDAAGTRAAVGLAAANLDTQLAAIDAAIAALNDYDGSDTAGTTTLLARLTAPRAGYLDNLSGGAAALEATAQSILEDTGTTLPATLATAAKLIAYVRLLARKDVAIATDHATELGEINANVASGAGSYDNATDAVQAIRDTEPLGTAMRGTDGANTTTPPSAAAIADQVWDEARADHTGAGSFGEGVASVQGNVTGEVAQLGTQAKADVKAEVHAAGGEAIPGTPSAGSAYEILEDVAAKLPATTIAEPGDSMDVTSLGGSTDALDRLAESAKAIATGAVQSDAGNTADTFQTNLGATDDKVNGRVLIFNAGTLRFQAGVITDYNGTTGFVTVESGSFTATPTAGDTFAVN